MFVVEQIPRECPMCCYQLPPFHSMCCRGGGMTDVVPLSIKKILASETILLASFFNFE